MEDLYKGILHDEQELDAKWLQRFLKKFKKPCIHPSWGFSRKVKRRLHRKMQHRKEAQEQVVLAGIPNFAKWRFRLAGFATAVCVFLFLFVLSFFTDFFSTTIAIPSKYTKVELFSFPDTRDISSAINEAIHGKAAKQASILEPLSMEMVGNDETEGLGYLYDGKKYPKVAAEMPVYKRTGALMNEELWRKKFGNLNIGGLSLKNFPQLQLSTLTLFDAQNGDVRVDVNAKNGEMYIFSVPVEPSLSLQDEKAFIKTAGNIIKSFGISLASYGKPEYKTEGVLFYPFLLQGKYRVWYPDDSKPMGIWVFYGNIQPTPTLSFHGIDIAKYEYTNYPTISKEEVLKDFTLGVKKLQVPEIVYLAKYRDGEWYFVPGLRFSVDEDTSLFKELVYVN